MGELAQYQAPRMLESPRYACRIGVAGARHPARLGRRKGGGVWVVYGISDSEIEGAVLAARQVLRLYTHENLDIMNGMV